MCVLEADSPLAEYRKITEEILKRMPDEHLYPRAADEAVRSFLMLRLGLHLGLRQKNLRQLLVCPRGQFPTAERRLEDMKRGELLWNEQGRGWEAFIPSNAFKNSGSSFLGRSRFVWCCRIFLISIPVSMPISSGIGRCCWGERPIRARVSSNPSKRPVSMRRIFRQHSTRLGGWRFSATAFTIRTPAAAQLRACYRTGPHNVRDVLATHILKQTGSYEQTSYAIQDTPDVVQQHYGRFLPQDKAELAARILNQVWEAA